MYYSSGRFNDPRMCAGFSASVQLGARARAHARVQRDRRKGDRTPPMERAQKLAHPHAAGESVDAPDVPRHLYMWGTLHVQPTLPSGRSSLCRGFFAPSQATKRNDALTRLIRRGKGGAFWGPHTTKHESPDGIMQRQRSGGKGNGAPLQRRATAAKTPSGHLQQQSQHQSTRKGARNNSTVSLSPSTSPLPDAAAADTLHRRTSLASMASLLRRCAFLGTQLNSWLTLLAMGAVLLLQLRAVSLMGYHCLMRRKKGRTEGRDSALQPMAAALPCGPILCVQCVARRGERRGGQKSSP